MIRRRSLAAMLSMLCLVVVSMISAQGEERKLPKIVFLGDSITYSGEYVAILETAAMYCLPSRPIEFSNLGLPSETVSGLSEEGHAGGKFPRPDLHERLDRLLEKVKPDFIVACYGMNDGIYQPLDDGRFDKFKDGIKRLHDKATKAGAKILHVTPPVYDAVPLKNSSRYDDVLAAYSAWLIERRKDDWKVVDLHGPMKAALEERRRNDPKFTFAMDGVHPNVEGHIVIANELYKLVRTGNAAAEERNIEWTPADLTNNKLFGLIQRRQQIERDAWLTHIGHKRPLAKGLPMDEANKKAGELREQTLKMWSAFFRDIGN